MRFAGLPQFRYVRYLFEFCYLQLCVSFVGICYSLLTERFARFKLLAPVYGIIVFDCIDSIECIAMLEIYWTNSFHTPALSSVRFASSVT